MGALKFAIAVLAASAGLMGGPALAQPENEPVEGVFHCVEASKLDRLLGQGLREVVRAIETATRLTIHGGNATYWTEAAMSGGGWSVRANHLGIVVLDRGTMQVPDANCMAEYIARGLPPDIDSINSWITSQNVTSTQQGGVLRPRCDFRYLPMSLEDSADESADLIWETMIFDASRGILTRYLTKSSGRATETFVHSCM